MEQIFEDYQFDKLQTFTLPKPVLAFPWEGCCFNHFITQVFVILIKKSPSLPTALLLWPSNAWEVRSTRRNTGKICSFLKRVNPNNGFSTKGVVFVGMPYLNPLHSRPYWTGISWTRICTGPWLLWSKLIAKVVTLTGPWENRDEQDPLSVEKQNWIDLEQQIFNYPLPWFS